MVTISVKNGKIRAILENGREIEPPKYHVFKRDGFWWFAASSGELITCADDLETLLQNARIVLQFAPFRK